MEDFATWCRSERTRLRGQLETLEAHRSFVARRPPGGEWEDVTPREIEQLKKTIKELDAFIAKYSA